MGTDLYVPVLLCAHRRLIHVTERHSPTTSVIYAPSRAIVDYWTLRIIVLLKLVLGNSCPPPSTNLARSAIYATVYFKASAHCLHMLDTVSGALRFITNSRALTHHCAFYSRVNWPSLFMQRLSHWFLAQDIVLMTEELGEKKPLMYLYRLPGITCRSSSSFKTVLLSVNLKMLLRVCVGLHWKLEMFEKCQ